MSAWLWLAVVAIVMLGVAHSVLGERYILVRLFRRTDLPHLFGSDWFTKRTLRFAWHLTSVAWFGMAAMIVLLAGGDPQWALRALSLTALLSAGIAFGATRGRHFAWLVFLVIGVALWTGVRGAP